MAVWAVALLAVNRHRARLHGAGDEGDLGPLSGAETAAFAALDTTGPTTGRGNSAIGFEMQASVVRPKEPGEDGDANHSVVSRENTKVPR